ncbi:unnamed protein product, partial [Urochloa humidicola]
TSSSSHPRSPQFLPPRRPATAEPPACPASLAPSPASKPALIPPPPLAPATPVVPLPPTPPLPPPSLARSPARRRASRSCPRRRRASRRCPRRRPSLPPPSATAHHPSHLQTSAAWPQTVPLDAVGAPPAGFRRVRRCTRPWTPPLEPAPPPFSTAGSCRAPPVRTPHSSPSLESACSPVSSPLRSGIAAAPAAPSPLDQISRSKLYLLIQGSIPPQWPRNLLSIASTRLILTDGIF